MRVAAIDIGTNSTRLLVADVEGGRADEVDRMVVVTGLGRGLEAAGVLSEESMARTVQTLADYAGAIEVLGAERMRAVATSATRDAGNSAAFLDRAESALGFRPDVVDGATEARLGFRGAVSGVDLPGPYLMIDPGGGSTEFVYGDDAPESVHSIDMGSVRLTERALPGHPAEEIDVLAAAGIASAVLGAMELPGSPNTVIGVGGTFTSLSAINLGLEHYDRRKVHLSRLDLADLGRLVGELALMSLGEIEAIPSLDPLRAPMILGGALVAEAALRRSGCESVVVSETDILDGVALGLGA